MQRLPAEIALHIFSHFGPLEIGRCLMLVCRSWSVLLRDDHLWLNIFRRHVKQYFRLELIAPGERPFDAYRRLHCMNLYARYAVWADLPTEVIVALNGRFVDGRWWGAGREALRGQLAQARPAVSLSRASHAVKNLARMEQLTEAVLSHTVSEGWNFEVQADHPVNVQYRTAVYDACRYKLHQLYGDDLVWRRLLCTVERRVAVLRERILADAGCRQRGTLLSTLRDEFLPAMRNIAIGTEYLHVTHGLDSMVAGLRVFRDGILLHPAVRALLGGAPPLDAARGAGAADGGGGAAVSAAAGVREEYEACWALLPVQLWTEDRLAQQHARETL